MLTCAKCKSANYCDKKCQKHHGKHGGHKKACGLATSSDANSKAHHNVAPPASAPKNSSNTQKKQPIDEDEPVHPCPICLGNEDIFGDCGQCNSCGQMFCGNCKPKIEALGKCPTCRAPLHGTPEDNFKNCVALVHERSVGRHTPVAQFNLGFMYRKGQGVKQNYTKALAYYQLASDQGNADAQSTLGFMYNNGQGVEQNYAKAVEYYQLAADQGCARAQCNLGFMYEGQGVEQNYAKAVAYYQLAADQGVAGAQYNLGSMYNNGDGVKQNYAKAVEYYRLAADQGLARAQHNLGGMYSDGTGVAKNRSTALKWIKLAAL